MVASKRNDGNGTKGIKDPKKLTRLSPIYPTSVAKGKIVAKSTNETVFFGLYNKNDHVTGSVEISK